MQACHGGSSSGVPNAWLRISAAPADGERGTDLRHGATLAAVHAGLQHQHEARFWFASPELSLEPFQKVTLGSELHGAAERGELKLHYQPKVDIDSHRVVGAEALIRWRHPKQGLIPAAEFIKLVQEHGLSKELGDWVFQWSVSTILTARRQLSWPVEAGN